MDLIIQHTARPAAVSRRGRRENVVEGAFNPAGVAPAGRNAVLVGRAPISRTRRHGGIDHGDGNGATCGESVHAGNDTK